MSRIGIWIANGALFVLCSYLTASLVNDWLGAWIAEAGPTAAAPPEAPPPPSRTWAERQVVLDRNLFQASTLLPAEPVADQPTEEELEATRLPLKLLGTVAASSPRDAWAAVEDTQQRRRQVVRVNDRLLEQATVLRIERRRIVLQNGARREELALDEDEVATTPLSARAASRAPQPAGDVGNLRERIQRLSQDRFQVQRDDVQEAMRNPAELFSQARILPKYENGAMTGVQINSIQPGSLFEQIGIQDGDVITEVNGIVVSSPQDSSALIQELTEANQFTVQVRSSDGQARTLNYVVEP
jgi:general secretion pathway protein C